MSVFARWWRFNLVGAMGMVVQLAALAVFNRWFRGHYLLATAAAIEVTLVHNFLWHRRYTWRERQDGADWVPQMLRFQSLNGLVSLLGNLVLMRLLVHGAHLPVLVANAMAIGCCSIANFCLSEGWAFARRERAPGGEGIAKHVVVLGLTVCVMSMTAAGQSAAGLPEAPVSSSSAQADAVTPKPVARVYHASPSASYLARAGVICAVGATTSPVATKPAGGCGAGIMFVPLPIFVEVGVMGPQANRSVVSGYLSVDADIPLAKSKLEYLPMAMVGYSRLFETGHSLDYGLALAMPRFGHRKDTTDSLRIELRDYWTFANPSQHNVMLRVGWMSLVRD